MIRTLGLAAVCLICFGCALKLPEIPQGHPANAGAPAGQVYATPAVLEVKPIVRPPHAPTSAPSDAAGRHNGMHHGNSGSRTIQQMQREGQRHD